MRPNFNEIAGIENGRDITRGWVGAIEHWLPSQDSILESKGGGDLELYERVRQDDRVKSCMQQRIAGVVSKDWIVSPGGDKRIDRLAADDLRDRLTNIEWDRITEKMLWGVFYGYSVAEAIFEQSGDRVGLKDIRVRNRRRFKFGADGSPRLITFESPQGEVLPDRQFWHFCCGGDNDDDPYGLGLAHWLYWPTWFKRNDLRWWILYLENFADPAVVGTYPDGATEEEKKKIEGFVRSVGKLKWATKSSSTLLEFLEASRSGTADYQAMYDVLNDAISTIILSQTMTTSDGASLSQAEVHQGVADAVIKSDSDLISSSFNSSIARWLTEWNFPGAAVPRCYRKLEAETDLKALADRDKLLFDMGFPPNLEYVIETYGEGFKQEATEASPVALNGAQLSSFVSLITSAQQAGWSKEMVRTSLEIAFPHVADALLDEMAKSFDQKEAADPAAGGATDIAIDDVVGMFARIPEGTVKGDKILKDSRWQNNDVEMPPAPPRPQQPLLAKPIQPRRLKPEAFSNSDREDFEGMMRDWAEISTWSGDIEIAFEKGLSGDITDRIRDGYSFAKNATGKDFRSVKAEGRIQAAAKVKDEGDALHIAGLGSAPWNNGLNDERSIRGAGKAMVASVIQESMDVGYGGKVTLEDTEESRPFYDAIGFDYGKKYPGHRYLTPEAAGKFMAAYRGNSAAFARSDFDWMDYIDLLEAIGGCNLPDRYPDPESATFAAPNKKNCVKGISCGNTCISASKACKKPLSPKQKAQKPPIVDASKPAKQQPANPAPDAAVDRGAVAATAPATEMPATAPSAPPVAESATTGDPVKVNQENLDTARAAIVAEAGEEAVARAEAVTKEILNSADTGVFVRVGSNATLAAILGDRFKNSVELGGDADVPGLTEPYQDARKRVEREQMGYADDSDPAGRPIYAYLGNAKNLNSESHEDVSAFGGITIKLKDEVKQRATFTGADSFKSGVASKVGDPSAASLIQNSRHGKPEDPAGVAGQIDRIGKAKNIDDLMSAVDGDGNRYVEAQIHGQVRPSDIGEIHFSRKGDPPVPSKEVRDWAERNGVKIFKDGEVYEHREVSEQRRKEIAKQMTPELFADFATDIGNREDQRNPDLPHNQTYEQWQTRQTEEINKSPYWATMGAKAVTAEIRLRTSKELYLKNLSGMVANGLFVDDAVLDSFAGKKNELQQIKKIRSDSQALQDKQRSRTQLYAEMEAILDLPLVSESDRAQHKPTMSAKEASAYVKDSAFGDHTFYHGSSSNAAIKSIEQEGVKISANETGVYGGGFYLGAGSDVANIYASKEGDVEGSVLSMKVKMKNPYITQDTSEVINALEDAGAGGSLTGISFGRRFGDEENSGTPAYLRLKGYDGIYVADRGYAIGFEREQMVAFSKQSSKPVDANNDISKPEVKALTQKLLKNAKNN